MGGGSSEAQGDARLSARLPGGAGLAINSREDRCTRPPREVRGDSLLALDQLLGAECGGGGISLEYGAGMEERDECLEVPFA